MSEEKMTYVTLKDWADGWVTAPEDTIVDGGPSSLWGAPDLCPKCGAYWECEHRVTVDSFERCYTVQEFR